MARLKELKRWMRKGKIHVRLEFVSGIKIEEHSFESPEEAETKADELRRLWQADLIAEQSSFIPTTRRKNDQFNEETE